MADINRRNFLKLAASAGITMAFCGNNPLAAMDKPVKNNNRRDLLLGAGMIWSSWLGYPKEYDLKQMDAFREIGGRLTSASFDWVDREPEQGKWDWAYTDFTVDTAQERGLKQFGYIGNTARWALPAGVDAKNSYRYPPRDDCEKDFRNYCRKTAERYAGRVDMFQFWNEPNGWSWMNEGGSNSSMYASYTKWLKIAYESLKEGNNNCVVAAGALDYHAGVKEGYKYIEGMYECGAKGYFDAISIHPYAEELHWQAIDDTRRVMKNHGDADKSIWITEYGWQNSKGNDSAEKLRKVLTRLMLPKYYYVKLANYLCITDLPIANTEQYGLFDRELNPRPIADMFKQMAKR